MAETTWLTQAAFDRLAAELEQLMTEGRTEIVRRIEAARAEGDLKENGGDHAAREEQGKMEGRIAQLKALLDSAKVGEAPADAGVAASGTVVTAQVAGAVMTFLVGSREVAATSDLDVYSENSPLGAAILGAAPGETRAYTAPNGKQITVTVRSVAPYMG
ncbi:MAG: transcription elongation factor GreA [Bifidobacteriaceae bacterium]|nr:transcription elongation factor GreA [Bifidobacteriaceae bacterium]